MASFSWLPLGTGKPLFLGGFSFSDESRTDRGPQKLIVDRKQEKGRTAAYVDGYNIYYGRLRGTPHKWLDVVRLCENILSLRDQNETLTKLNLFTAPALARFARHGDQSVQAQSAYHRALAALYRDRFEAVYGEHSYDRSGSLLPTFIAGQPCNRDQRSRVWKLEKKKTDVNLALRMYRDARKGLYDRIILVTNDSDAEPALAAVREDFPHIMIGLVIPIKPPKNEERPRRSSGSLVKHASWVISHLTDAQLEGAHLPRKVPTNKKPIIKPEHW